MENGNMKGIAQAGGACDFRSRRPISRHSEYSFKIRNTDNMLS